MPTPKPSKLRAKASSSNENKGLSTRNPSREEPAARAERSAGSVRFIEHSSHSIWAGQTVGALVLQQHEQQRCIMPVNHLLL